MNIKCGFAYLDVTRGRAALRRTVERGDEAVFLALRGRVTAVHGNDDGVSQEFELTVDDLEVGDCLADAAVDLARLEQDYSGLSVDPYYADLYGPVLARISALAVARKGRRATASTGRRRRA